MCAIDQSKLIKKFIRLEFNFSTLRRMLTKILNNPIHYAKYSEGIQIPGLKYKGNLKIKCSKTFFSLWNFSGRNNYVFSILVKRSNISD